MKKLLSLVMSVVMMMTLLAGCGKKESSYFKEMNELTEIKTGTAVMEMDIQASEVDAVPMLVDNGKTSVKIKLEATAESNKKSAVKVSAKFGSAEYMEVTTMVVDEYKLYLDLGSIVETIKVFDEDVAAQVETVLGQIGATKKVSLDLKQVMAAMGQEMPKTENMEAESLKVVKEMISILEKDFSELQGKDGDDYTLSLNAENADKAVAAVDTFAKNDLKDLYTKFFDLIINAYGKDSDLGKQIAEMQKDTTDIDEIAKGMSDEQKEKAIKTIKDAKMNIVSKIQVNGKEGSRVAKLSVDTGDITIPADESGTGKDEQCKIAVTCEIKEGKVSIQDMIPTDAMDLTAMMTAMMNMQGLEGTEGIQ